MRLTPLFLLVFLTFCIQPAEENKNQGIRIIIDTDANNELDDQHALAYALLRPDLFDIEGITVNNTINGGGIEGHILEAGRILAFCKKSDEVPVLKGASGNYTEIEPFLSDSIFDGHEAVDFIIEKASEPITVIALGKLTNIALALKKDPSIIQNLRIIWLGSNYPFPGEYNFDNDRLSVNPVILSGARLEIALVMNGMDYGTEAVTVPIAVVEEKLRGKGYRIQPSIEGRNGGFFHCFGDYAIDLWNHIDLYGESRSRSLFDLAAVSVTAHPHWAKQYETEAPLWNEDLKTWQQDSLNPHKIILWQYFEKDSILNDFFNSMDTGN